MSKRGSGRVLKAADAYAWMRECQKLTEKHGGFSQKDMLHMRGYQPFSVVARNLGYLTYTEQRFVWISESITMVMAEMIMHEHHIRNERLNKAKAAVRREMQINDPPVEVDKIPIEQTKVKQKKAGRKNKKNGFWASLFSPQPDPFGEFMEQIFRHADNPFAQIDRKLDVINENQIKLAAELTALRKALTAFVDEDEV